jgi:integrase
MASVRSSRGLLYIDFTYRKKRQRVYLGLHDTPQNRGMLEIKSDMLTNAIKAEKLGMGEVDFEQIFPGLGLFKKSETEIAETRYQTETFDTLYLEWVALKTHVTRNYMRTLKSFHRNHISPFIGHKLLNDITQKDIKIMIEAMQRVNKNATINRKLRAVKSFFSELVEDNHIKVTPFRKIKTLRNEKVDILPFTKDELSKLLDGFRELYPEYLGFVSFLAFCGCRPNEAVGLKWDKIDWENNKILIREGVVLGEDSMLKTESSIRDLDINASLASILKAQREASYDRNSEYVFVNSFGRRICWEAFRPLYHKVLKAKGITHRPAYQLRHTFASMALKAGEDPMWVSRTLGHSNLRTTLNVYARYIPSSSGKDGSIIGGMYEAISGENNE